MTKLENENRDLEMQVKALNVKTKSSSNTRLAGGNSTFGRVIVQRIYLHEGESETFEDIVVSCGP